MQVTNTVIRHDLRVRRLSMVGRPTDERRSPTIAEQLNTYYEGIAKQADGRSRSPTRSDLSRVRPPAKGRPHSSRPPPVFSGREIGDTERDPHRRRYRVRLGQLRTRLAQRIADNARRTRDMKRTRRSVDLMHHLLRYRRVLSVHERNRARAIRDEKS